jgi:hypothetical protein
MTQVEAKYMRLRQLTGELRGKDMEVGRLLEDKMRILAEILEEQGVQPPPLPPLRYTLLVQEREKSLTKEELLQVSSTKFLCFIFLGDFYFVLYSTLLHLPPLRFHCADGCWDRTQDSCNWCIGSQTL